MMNQGYENRTEAGLAIAQELSTKIDTTGCVVYGLSRGGVPVAAAVAAKLDLPLEVMVVRKIGMPGNPELAAGAVTDPGGLVVNEELRGTGGLSEEFLQQQAEQARNELYRQSDELLLARTQISPQGKTVLLVDDGLATGASMDAAVKAVRKAGAARVIVCVPVGSAHAVGRLNASADEVYCLLTPPEFNAVSQWYQEFGQVTNEEVRALLVAASE